MREKRKTRINHLFVYGLKTCKDCEEVKLLEDFSTDNSVRDGKRPVCHTCDAARKAKWLQNNLHRHRAKSAAHRARRLRATPRWADRKAIVSIYKEAENVAKTTGLSHHVDHIVPLKSKLVCGLHVEHNLRILEETENLSKSNRHWPDMWK